MRTYTYTSYLHTAFIGWQRTDTSVAKLNFSGNPSPTCSGSRTCTVFMYDVLRLFTDGSPACPYCRSTYCVAGGDHGVYGCRPGFAGSLGAQVRMASNRSFKVSDGDWEGEGVLGTSSHRGDTYIPAGPSPWCSGLTSSKVRYSSTSSPVRATRNHETNPSLRQRQTHVSPSRRTPTCLAFFPPTNQDLPHHGDSDCEI